MFQFLGKLLSFILFMVVFDPHSDCLESSFHPNDTTKKITTDVLEKKTGKTLVVPDDMAMTCQGGCVTEEPCLKTKSANSAQATAAVISQQSTSKSETNMTKLASSSENPCSMPILTNTTENPSSMTNMSGNSNTTINSNSERLRPSGVAHQPCPTRIPGAPRHTCPKRETDKTESFTWSKSPCKKSKLSAVSIRFRRSTASTTRMPQSSQKIPQRQHHRTTKKTTKRKCTRKATSTKK